MHRIAGNPSRSTLLYLNSPNHTHTHTHTHRTTRTNPSRYFEGTSFLLSKEATAARAHGTPLTFYDSVTGAPLFIAPRGRSWDNFVEESMAHGWPSFRDEECVLDNVRVLPDGEAVSIHGTHLGHNLPDAQGNRYCINLVSVAGRPRGGGSATAAAAAGAAAGAAVVT